MYFHGENDIEDTLPYVQETLWQLVVQRGIRFQQNTKFITVYDS